VLEIEGVVVVKSVITNATDVVKVKMKAVEVTADKFTLNL